MPTELKELTEKDWKNLINNNICPDCEHQGMWQGPTAPGAENVKCKNCNQEFWICSIPGQIRRI